MTYFKSDHFNGGGSGAECGNLVAKAFGWMEVVTAIKQLTAVAQIDREIEAVVAADDRLPIEIDFDRTLGFDGDRFRRGGAA